MAQTVDLIVDAAVFFDERVGLRDIGFGLIVVVVRDEVFDGVVGEELAELRAKLSGERLIVRHNEGRALNLLDQVRDGEGLSGSGGSEERLKLVAPAQTGGQVADSVGLVARRGIVGDDFEFAHRDHYTRIGVRVRLATSARGSR